MKILQSIALDFNRDTLPITVFAKQYDKESRLIAISPLNSGQTYELEAGVVPRLQLTKADGHTVINDCTVEDGVIMAELTEQCLVVAGIATAEIGLYKDDGLLSSQTFYIDVKKSAYESSAPESSDEFNSLVNALSRVEAVNDITKAALETATNAMEKMEEVENSIDEHTSAAAEATNRANAAALKAENVNIRAEQTAAGATITVTDREGTETSVHTSAPDWSENDETAGGYIKNRPFYEKPVLRDSITVPFGEPAESVDGIELYILNQRINLEGGKEYTVDLVLPDGSQQTVTVTATDGSEELGLPPGSAIGIDDSDNGLIIFDGVLMDVITGELTVADKTMFAIVGLKSFTLHHTFSERIIKKIDMKYIDESAIEPSVRNSRYFASDSESTELFELPKDCKTVDFSIKSRAETQDGIVCVMMFSNAPGSPGNSIATNFRFVQNNGYESANINNLAMLTAHVDGFAPGASVDYEFKGTIEFGKHAVHINAAIMACEFSTEKMYISPITAFGEAIEGTYSKPSDLTHVLFGGLPSGTEIIFTGRK